MKYLGIIIDDKLQFEDYYDYLLKKIGKKINFLNRIDNFVSKLLDVYYLDVFYINQS